MKDEIQNSSSFCCRIASPGISELRLHTDEFKLLLLLKNNLEHPIKSNRKCQSSKVKSSHVNCEVKQNRSQIGCLLFKTYTLHNWGAAISNWSIVQAAAKRWRERERARGRKKNLRQKDFSFYSLYSGVYIIFYMKCAKRLKWWKQWDRTDLLQSKLVHL